MYFKTNLLVISGQVPSKYNNGFNLNKLVNKKNAPSNQPSHNIYEPFNSKFSVNPYDRVSTDNLHESSTKLGSNATMQQAASKMLEESILSYQTDCTKNDCEFFPDESNLYASILKNNKYIDEQLKLARDPQKYTEINFKKPLKRKNYPHFEDYQDYFEIDEDKSLDSGNQNSQEATPHQEFMHFNNNLIIGKKIPNLDELFKQIPEDYSGKLTQITDKAIRENLKESYFNYKLNDKNSPFMYSGEELFDDNSSEKYYYDIQFQNNKNYEEILKKKIDVCLSGCLIYKSKCLY